jgi:hypothetical protein
VLWWSLVVATVDSRWWWDVFNVFFSLALGSLFSSVLAPFSLLLFYISSSFLFDTLWFKMNQFMTQNPNFCFYHIKVLVVLGWFSLVFLYFPQSLHFSLTLWTNILSSTHFLLPFLLPPRLSLSNSSFSLFKLALPFFLCLFIYRQEKVLKPFYVDQLCLLIFLSRS